MQVASLMKMRRDLSAALLIRDLPSLIPDLAREMVSKASSGVLVAMPTPGVCLC